MGGGANRGWWKRAREEETKQNDQFEDNFCLEIWFQRIQKKN